MSESHSGLDRRMWMGLMLFALLLPISIVLVQPVAYAVAVMAMIAWWKTPKCERPPYTFGTVILVFLAVVVVVSIFGIRPETSFKKFNRFLVLALAWSIPWMIHRFPDSERSQRIGRLVALFLVGIGLKAAFDLVRVPVLVSMGMPLFSTGSMRDPQFYMAGVCFAAGLILTRGWSLRYPPTWAAILFSVAGLVIHFKRGTWSATVAALAVMSLASRRWRPLGLTALLLVTLLMIPSIRERVGQLEREFSPESGGRLLLWTEIGPELIRSHPLGVGWKAVKHEDFVAVSDRVEPKLNHLHNNFMQVTLELGWAGLAVWIYWMGSILFVCWTAHHRNLVSDPVISGVSLGALGAFSGLMANGLVEYNFGASEIFMLMIFVMGLAASVNVPSSDRIPDGGR